MYNANEVFVFWNKVWCGNTSHVFTSKVVVHVLSERFLNILPQEMIKDTVTKAGFRDRGDAN